MLFGRFGFLSSNPGEETLDTPINNFDVIGIPTNSWSSHLFACYENVIPSCFLSFFCPCVLWAQIVVRAQIPLLIGIKNSLPIVRRTSGYGGFVEYYFWSFAIASTMLILLILANLSGSPFYIVLIILIAVLIFFLYALGHTRTAFREKYLLPGFLPRGSEVFDMLLDIMLMTVCQPCALSQMARHVFQYNRMDSDVGCFMSDPTLLPPLPPLDIERANDRGEFQRPQRADNAGLTWANDSRHPNARVHTGAADRQDEIISRQVNQIRNTNNHSNNVVQAQPVYTNNGELYNADGSRV